MAETNDMQELPRMKRWVFVACSLVSVPAAVLLEVVTRLHFLGGRLMFYLAPWGGPQPYSESDWEMNVLAGLALDSALCFAVLAGVYWLVYPFFGKRR